MFGYRFGMTIFFNQIWIVIFISVLVSVKLFFKLTSARCNSKVTLLGKTALVTGGSSGIGYQIATELASRGCTVILAQNIVDDKIRKTLVEKTNNPHIFLEYVDLSSFESVRKLVERLKKTLTKLDILINNAGIGLVPEVLTEDGLMLTWQVNYYSSFLLTYLLLDLMKNSEAGRIIFTSSLTSHFHTTHIKYIRNNKIECTTGIFNYFNTKFLLILAADYFAKKLRKFNITSNSYHPGIVMTPIYGDSFKNCRSILDYVFLQLILIGNFFAGKSLEEGVQTVLHLAVAKEVANVTGIGYQTAVELASRGCKVILAQRRVDEELRDTLMEKTNNPHIFLEYVDLSSFESVRKLAEKLKKTVTKLDILINNAGIGIAPKVLTEDGLRFTWQVNYYSPFLLTYLLSDLVRNSEAGRIIFTSSISSYFHNTQIKDIRNNRIECTMDFFDYPNTKFLSILSADYFAKKLKKFNITSNSYHPGIVKTPIFENSFQNCRGIFDFVGWQLILIGNSIAGKSLEESVQTVLHLAVAKEVANVTGEFFGETTKSFKPRGANNKEFCEKIWKSTECAVGLEPGEILE